jgi:ABC-type antimicrobial peptide transport system permease subunit
LIARFTSPRHRRSPSAGTARPAIHRTNAVSTSRLGLTSFAVARRSHEIGVRLALGAARRSIVWLVVREVAMLTLIGGAIGLAGYVAASRAVGSFLFGLSATDPPTVAAATIVLAAVALSAGFIPVWRATHLDPALTLRNE